MDYIFYEDNKYRKRDVLFVATFILIIGFLWLLGVLFFTYLQPLPWRDERPELTENLSMLIWSLCFLMISFLLYAYAIKSKRFKLFIAINEDAVTWFTKSLEECQYQTRDLVKYEVLNTVRRATRVKLSFVDDRAIIITTRKLPELTKTLDYLIHRNENEVKKALPKE